MYLRFSFPVSFVAVLEMLIGTVLLPHIVVTGLLNLDGLISLTSYLLLLSNSQARIIQMLPKYVADRLSRAGYI